MIKYFGNALKFGFQIQVMSRKVLRITLKINVMKLKNTPWTCEFEPMQNWHIKDNSGYWFALAIEDADTARAIAALPQTLTELERHKKLHQGMLDVQQELEAELERVKEERDELKAFVKKIASGNYFRKDVYEEAKELLKDK